MLIDIRGMYSTRIAQAQQALLIYAVEKALHNDYSSKQRR